MDIVLIILLVLLLAGAFPAYSYGGPYLGGGVGLLFLIVLILLIVGGHRA